MDKLELHNRFAVVEPAGFKKPVMVKLQLKKSRISGIVQNNAVAYQPDIIDINADEILCVFTNNQPRPGSVYKCDVDPFIESFKAKQWGNIFLYRGMAEAEKKNLTKAMTRVYFDFLKPNKLTHVVPITLEVRNNKGTTQGYYRPEKKGMEHAICLSPTSFIVDGVEGTTRLLAHEIGHPLLALYLPDDYKTKWISLYSTYNVLRELTVDDLKSHYADFANSNSLPSEYKRNLEEDAKVVFNAVLKYIKVTHHLSIKELDLMVTKKSSAVEKYWPMSKIKLSEMQTPISKYAGKNYMELWCECLAEYVIGTELPEQVRKLVKFSIKSMQAK